MTVSKRTQTTIEDFFGKNTSMSKKQKIEKTIVETNTNIISQKSSIQGNESKISDIPESNLKTQFRASLDNDTSALLSCELDTMEDSWFAQLKDEFKKPYFLQLKKFVTEEQKKQKVFPPSRDIYSWTRLTPFKDVKVVIIGQDPYHNHDQAHGLAFSVKPPVPAPPSLKNIYKELKQNYSDFIIDNTVGDLTPWTTQGVLLLNTALTVRAHNAGSHSKQGWEQFTKRAVELLIADREKTGQSLVFLLWGNNAIKLVSSILKGDEHKYKNILVLKSVHPSPLSASRGFFGNNHFRRINEWLYNERKEKMIDWSVEPGSSIKEISESNQKLN
ncbi:hypothetical protein NCAS_0H02710 [Naumovozyma castellii]|uniref:Uracil-DNA glycosylase n=1 Tax=Naumovozyma castellii TaxID=27288 RepID=G0VJA2_NAUCA|nr:hypothetical protein NCAS_0H02710 [Naumovozyma castellii CBS 4309]CCC71581.1 hypothetical protein NCAS_0H02710 [Naumovozyma castellii CBS 4309]